MGSVTMSLKQGEKKYDLYNLFNNLLGFKGVVDQGPKQRESKLTVLCLLIIIILIIYIII
jgi:hypothetical protein